ncbi:MAG: RES family NAD+ phosphorylase [Chroococcus sp. CMT-3BRIN-NPC107]|nr:RES family NAD+ phosphorylase [Chroococcus sp. CMT-3BRIN-NPC107]
MVEIAPPPPKILPSKPVLYSIDEGECLVRIFDPTRYNIKPLTFRHYGPVARFDHQRYSKDAPATDEERGIYYTGFTLSCCLVEVFGDKRTIDVGNYCVALVELKRPLSLLDLCGTPAMANGTVVALSSVPQRDISQSWSRYFYENCHVYTKVDGIIYNNAHNGERSVALYERATDALNCSPNDVMALSHKALRTEIRKVAELHGLIVVPY